MAFNFAEESKKNLDVGVAVGKKAGVNTSKAQISRDNLDAIMRILVNKNE